MLESMSGLQELRSTWNTATRDFGAEQVLVQELGIPSLVAAVLVRRGYGELSAANKFLNPSLDDLYDPKLLPDYDKAVKEILGAKERGELIYVHGDYDVDGVSSTALMTRFLEKVGCKVVPHVPHRIREGYGIHLDAVNWAKEQGVKLFLTCDCGISAFDQLDAARSAGMRTVVTDHHEPKALLPKADAVVNPHRKDSQYPFKELSGSGVVFKLCQGLSNELGIKIENYFRAYLDLAVLGTVADVMPLVDENRIITKFGLERVSESKKAGLRALKSVSGIRDGDRVSSRDIGFKLGPRINAVGRIDDADVALKMFLTDNDRLAMEHAEYLDRRNNQRREDQAAMVEQAVAVVAEKRLNEQLVMVVASEEWHPGIIGIVAGKLVEQFRRPTFVLAIGSDGVAKGSARSLPGFNLAEAIEKHHYMLKGGGGHELAAGMSIDSDRITEFSDEVNSYASSIVSVEDFAPVYDIDAEVSFAEAGSTAAEAMEALQPFGAANPEPLFSCYGVQMVGFKRTKNPEHAILTYADGGHQQRAVGWRLADSLEPGLGKANDLLFRLEINEFNNHRSAQWNVVEQKTEPAD